MIPELSSSTGTIRVPELRSVPLTPRIVAIVDHPAFQRLRRVRQLGPTHLVYPGAVHTRFEHSLGVFDMARTYLAALLRRPEAASLTEADVSACLLAALLHDLGHYPFAHSLEALHHPGRDTPRHEDLTARILLGEVPSLRGERPIGDLIRQGFGLDPQEVVDIVTQKPSWHVRPERRLVASVISSGVDADKADYLERDSLHMGVTYGRNYDRARFLESLTVGTHGDRIAVTDKGRVSAEIFIFCRYTMFSEAYWHHAVRSVSAMVERALDDFRTHVAIDGDALVEALVSRADDELLAWLLAEAPAGSDARRLLEAMTGGRRRFFKRVVTLARGVDDVRIQTAYERVYHLRPAELLELRRRIAATLSREVGGAEIALSDVIVDTPPRDKDRVETVEVVYDHGGRRRGYPLEQLSRVVQGISTDFVKVVKKIRVFVAPDVRDRIERAGRREALADAVIDTIVAYSPDEHPQQSLL